MIRARKTHKASPGHQNLLADAPGIEFLPGNEVIECSNRRRRAETPRLCAGTAVFLIGFCIKGEGGTRDSFGPLSQACRSTASVFTLSMAAQPDFTTLHYQARQCNETVV